MMILIVDDDEQILRMMARLLGRRGHQVELDPPPQIVLWSAEDATVQRLLDEGTHPVVSKRANPSEVIDALERLFAARAVRPRRE